MDELYIDDVLELAFPNRNLETVVNLEEVESMDLDSRGEPPGSTRARPLMVGDGTALLYVERDKGSYDPLHVHPDHESMSYLLRGKVEVTIGGETYTITQDEAFYHGPGVVHDANALEDSAKLEIKHIPPE
jgi:quercetin dioxygenase-like cupin family protein